MENKIQCNIETLTLNKSINQYESKILKTKKYYHTDILNYGITYTE